MFGFSLTYVVFVGMMPFGDDVTDMATRSTVVVEFNDPEWDDVSENGTNIE